MKLSKREYIFVGVIFVLLCVISVSAFRSFFNEEEAKVEAWFMEEFEQEEIKTEEAIVLHKIVIDVKGAVNRPGVYEIDEGSRVIDVIELAGGVLQNADVNQVNFAELLKDEMVVYVPTIGEDVAVIQGGTVAGSTHDEKIRINYATSEELQKLSGIGPAKAEAIIRYREENGPFQVEEDLLNVSGIGQKSFEKIKDEITVK